MIQYRSRCGHEKVVMGTLWHGMEAPIDWIGCSSHSRVVVWVGGGGLSVGRLNWSERSVLVRCGSGTRCSGRGSLPIGCSLDARLPATVYTVPYESVSCSLPVSSSGDSRRTTVSSSLQPSVNTFHMEGMLASHDSAIFFRLIVRKADLRNQRASSANTQ